LATNESLAEPRGDPARLAILDAPMSEGLFLWRDFNVSLVAATAGLLGLLFVARSIHVRVLSASRNAELRAVTRSDFLGYVVALAIGFLALGRLQHLGADLPRSAHRRP
jgi:hypothetical protein